MIAYRLNEGKVTEIVDLPKNIITQLGLIVYEGALPVPDYDWMIHDVFIDENGNFKVVSKSDAELQELNLTNLRNERKVECFSVINRGQLWYSMLTAAQYTELQTWYQAWLDVTETLVIPEKPSWLE